MFSDRQPRQGVKGGWRFRDWLFSIFRAMLMAW